MPLPAKNSGLFLTKHRMFTAVRFVQISMLLTRGENCTDRIASIMCTTAGGGFSQATAQFLKMRHNSTRKKTNGDSRRFLSIGPTLLSGQLQILLLSRTEAPLFLQQI